MRQRSTRYTLRVEFAAFSVLLNVEEEVKRLVRRKGGRFPVDSEDLKRQTFIFICVPARFLRND